jgi:hypothetical protein
MSMTNKLNKQPLNENRDQSRLLHHNYDGKGTALTLCGKIINESNRKQDLSQTVHSNNTSNFPLLKLRKVPENEARNIFGHNELQIISFNIDGRGTARIKWDGEMSQLYGHDLDLAILGDFIDNLLIYKESEYRSHPLLKLRLINGREKHTDLGYKAIDIVEFNYDSKGTALARFDGELDSLHKSDLYGLLFPRCNAYQITE